MEPKQIHYFISIAETGSLAASSRELHIAQPALTRQIQRLEEQLGLELFHRHARGMELTAAGEQFYHDSLKLVDQMALARSRATKAHEGTIGRLNIGITPQHLWLTEIQQYLHTFHLHYPHIAFNLHLLQSQQQALAIRRRELDAGFMFLRPIEDSNLVGQLIYHETIKLAVHRDSPFATAPPETFYDLQDDAFIWTPPKHSFFMHRLIIRTLERYQFSPKIIHEGDNFNALISLVSAGLGYSFIPATMGKLNISNVILHNLPELKKPLTLDLELVWHRANNHPSLPHFIEIKNQ